MGRVERRRVSVLALASVVAGAAVSLASGCARFEADDQLGGLQDAAAQRALADGMASAYRPELTVSPSDGASGVSPTQPVTAVVTGGQISQAELRTAGAGPGGTLPGVLSPDGARWSSTAPLKPDTSYVLHTVLRATSGQESPSDTTFSTLAPGQQVTGAITPKDGGTANPASPVSIVFTRPIDDRAAVERSLAVVSTSPVRGSTHWQGDRELVWQADEPWPAGSKVTATLNFFGRQVGPELFGGSDLRSTFRVGAPAQASSDEPAGTGPADLPPNATDPSLAAPVDPGAARAPGAAPGPSARATTTAPNTAPRTTAPRAGTPNAATPSAAPSATRSGAAPSATRSNPNSSDTPSRRPTRRSQRDSSSRDNSGEEDQRRSPSLPVLH